MVHHINKLSHYIVLEVPTAEVVEPADLAPTEPEHVDKPPLFKEITQLKGYNRFFQHFTLFKPNCLCTEYNFFRFDFDKSPYGIYLFIYLF